MHQKISSIMLIGFILIAFSLPAWSADEYPNKAIQLVIPFPPGGPIDLSARIVGEKMGEYLGQPVVAVNKPGGGTAIAAGSVAGAKPDGYTLFSSPATLVFLPMITPNLSFKVSDFVPIGQLVSFNFLLLVNKDVPVKTLPELVAYARKNPRALSYGGSTFGSTQHIIGELLKLTANVDLQFIPFGGENPAITALLGNHIQVGILTIFQWPHVKSNAVRALAVLSAKRDPLLPQVPTAVEQGFPDLSVAAGYNLFLAPARTPAPIVKKLEWALEKALQDKTTRERVEKTELTPDFLNSRTTQALLDDEIKKWAPVVKKASIVVK
jgi:tripartite-type tricarboxylate transporter receptor subunit TctC